MSLFRRVYLYAVAFVSLEIVLWGLISLLRALLNGEGMEPERLAGALALIVAGAPVFGLHWWLAQRGRRYDAEEAHSRVRAIFLYGVLLATFMPAIQNALALVDRTLLVLLGASSADALIGAEQSWSDNLIALLVNGLAGAFFWRVTRQDWEAGPEGDAYPEIRRLYRYFWLVYALAALIGGGGSLVMWLIEVLLDEHNPALLANGLAALLVGGALWVFIRRLIRRSLAEPAERESILRLTTLYLLTFTGLAGMLLAAWIFLSEGLEALLGGSFELRAFLLDMAGPLSVGLPFGFVFAYYRTLLGREMRGQPISLEAGRRVAEASGEETREAEKKQKRAGLARLYFYTLALAGLAMGFSGLQNTLQAGIEALTGVSTTGDPDWQARLSLGLAAALIGLPLWFYAWRPMQKEAGRASEAGDYARRAPIRKGYLYLALFAGVVGAMFSAGLLLYELIGQFLGVPQFDPVFSILNNAKALLLYGVLWFYHWRVLRADSLRAERALAQRHAQYPVLLLAPDSPGAENGSPPTSPFVAELVTALQRQAPALPVAVHPYREGVPDETLSAAQAVIIPGELLTRPSEAWRLWLQAFPGERLVVPTETSNWHWISGGGSLTTLARRTAALVRQLAEGGNGRSRLEFSPWLPLAYAVAGVIAVILVISILVAGATMFLP